MERSCNVCKKNKTESEFGCPYLGLEKNYFYDFPLYGNPKFGLHGCPVYYLNEYNFIFDIFKKIDRGLIDKNILRWRWRYIFEVIEDFKDLELKAKLKEAKTTK